MILIHTEQNRQAPGPYQELALAVIRQAADDYRSLGRRIEASGSDLERKRMEGEMKSISRFFLSNWFCLLSGSDDGAAILERLDKEVFGDD
ncbi:MAG: hypothetical protein IKE04_02115 [Oscillospiraceae bacterium]|nr:hypothetical protein [Oscillospiraceae bacterium]MBR6953979.1 hypothetical protein [Clostridia bacterium]